MSKKTILIIIVVFLLLGIFFLSPNMTGNAVMELEKTNSNVFGIFFLVAFLFLFVIELNKESLESKIEGKEDK